jgi:protein-disulfide isomerase
MPITPGRDHTVGGPDASVSVVEYADFECPFCAAAEVSVKRVRERMGDGLLFAFRHFPLTTVHPHAWGAAEASEAAGSQGQFWPMHDLLFEDQKHLAVPDLIARAKTLGLDVERFERELLGRMHAVRVEEDFLSGVRSGVMGTPTFFINGMRHDGSYDEPTLMNALERATVAR